MATGTDKSRRVDLAPEPIRLNRSTWLPEQTSLDELTRPSDLRSLEGSTCLLQPRSLDIEWAVRAEKSRWVDLNAGAG